MNYNFKFASDVADSSVLSMLKSSEDTSAKHYRVCIFYIYSSVDDIIMFVSNLSFI